MISLPPARVGLKAKLFRGLADPSRLAILEALREGPLCVTEIVRATRMSQPNASLHLDCLWCCGLVGRRREGRFVRYWIRSPRVSRLLEEADRELNGIGRHIAACARYGGGRNRRGPVRKPARRGESRALG